MSEKMMNRVRFWGEASRIEELLKAVCYDGKLGTLDFGKLLPMPTALSHEEQLAWMQRNWAASRAPRIGTHSGMVMFRQSSFIRMTG